MGARDGGGSTRAARLSGQGGICRAYEQLESFTFLPQLHRGWTTHALEHTTTSQERDSPAAALASAGKPD